MRSQLLVLALTLASAPRVAAAPRGGPPRGQIVYVDLGRLVVRDAQRTRTVSLLALTPAERTQYLQDPTLPPLVRAPLAAAAILAAVIDADPENAPLVARARAAVAALVADVVYTRAPVTDEP